MKSSNVPEGKLFWVDPKRGVLKTYDQLCEDLNNKKRVKYFIYYDNPYDIILELIHSILTSRRVELIDHTFQKTEIENLGLDYETVLRSEIFTDRLDIKNVEDLLLKLKDNRWEVALYTSGTTGIPKKIWHNFKNLTRAVRIGEKYKDNVWAFAYNPTHMAGLQVFFQALLNINPMIYVFELERKQLPNYLEKFAVTNISATPSFYKSFLAYIREPIMSVQRVTCGGEKFDPTIERELRMAFPNSKIINIYALTEAGTIFSTEGEYFEISDEIKECVRIDEKGELLLHQKLLGKSDDLILTEEGWYRTGDIVEKVDDCKFKFVHRENELINVGGYKVNPHEVEEELRKMEEIIDAHVYAKKNRITGNILVADLVLRNKDLDKNQLEYKIFDSLSKKLQPWKIPRVLNFVDSIQFTRTGKKVRI